MVREPDELAARLEIELTLRAYVHAVDHGLFAELLALFQPSGSLVPHGLDACRGHAAIQAFLTGSRRTRRPEAGFGRVRHHVTAAQIDFDSSDAARALSYFSAISGVGLDHWGVYRDELRRQDGSWLFARRVVELEGANPRGWIGSGSGPVKFEPLDDAAEPS